MVRVKSKQSLSDLLNSIKSLADKCSQSYPITLEHAILDSGIIGAQGEVQNKLMPDHKLIQMPVSQ